MTGITQGAETRKDDIAKKPKKELTPEQRKRYSERQKIRYQNLPPEEKARKLEYQRNRHRSFSEEKRLSERERLRVYRENCSEESKQIHREKSSKWQKEHRALLNERRRNKPKVPKTEAERIAAKEYHTAWRANLTPEQKEAQRQKAKQWRACNPKTAEQKAKDCEAQKERDKRIPVEVKRAKAREQYAKLTAEQKKVRQERIKQKYREDIEFNITTRIYYGLRRRSQKKHIFNWVRRALNRNGESAAFKVIAGYTIAELRVSLESMFTDGMNWERFMLGEIHIDHINPLSSYDLSDMDQLRQAWAIDNLQPLWARDNLIKSNKTNAFR